MGCKPEERRSSDPPPSARPRSRWWFAAVAAGLLVGETVAKSRSGMPFAVSILDALVLVALAVVLGTYVILARADREPMSSGEQGPSADEPPV